MSQKKELPYPEEFKASSVNLALHSGQPITKTAKGLGINANTLHTWIRKYSRSRDTMIKTREQQNEEIISLKKELLHITQERDLLKKAAAYFAMESK